MLHSASFCLALACAALLCGAAAQDQVTIRRAGYPEPRVGDRSACGQKRVVKGGLNPDYFLHVVFGGFREGTCAQIGYTKYEGSKVAVEVPTLPFFGQRNSSFEIYSRDPTALDVAGCIGRECESELLAFGSSPYLKDVVHCISPALGPCAPKAWSCLGDNVCRSALECLPGVAKTCGKDIWTVVTDPVERKKMSCIWDCGNSKTCVQMKCGKDALECLTGLDSECHKAATCLPEEILKCSAPAFHCLFSRDGICRDNLACLAKGANVCADPAVNMLTDKSIAGAMYCANKRCPAPAGLPQGAPLQGLELAPPSHYPEQLACMGLNCAGAVTRLLGDKDVGAMATCLLDGLESCGDGLWSCLGDQSCKSNVQCWADSVGQDSDDVWKIVTDRSERMYDRDLFVCLSNCEAQGKNPFAKAFCIASACGKKALGCLSDPTCRDIFTDMPKAILKCGPPSWKDTNFTQAAKCIARMAGTCGRTGIELVRDENLANIVQCNAKCTRPPLMQTEVVV